MTNILNLPDEILQIIIDYAAISVADDRCQFLGWQYPKHNYYELKCLAQTCRRLYLITAPSLWRDKDFVLPCEDDTIGKESAVGMATDVLGRKTIFHYPRCVGYYVHSLSRDLTSGNQNDMNNSALMSQLVPNLRSLRMDFSPAERNEKYGLDLFVKSCPSLDEIYLENCRDTFDDFKSLLDFKRPLKRITLLCCTVKESTLTELMKMSGKTLQDLLFQRVLIEPPSPAEDRPRLFSRGRPAVIAQPIFNRILSYHSLTQLALSDSLSHSTVQTIVTGSQNLEKLAIILGEMDSTLTNHCITLLASLHRLTILSLAFRNVDPYSGTYERLPCVASPSAWSYFAARLPHISLIHISATEIRLSAEFFVRLFTYHTNLPNVMLHHIRWAYEDATDDIVREWLGWKDIQDHFMTQIEAQRRGFTCFDMNDRVCFVKGFEEWTR
ncbi:hypothetical protein VKS41_005535 [Umbelopsis sp. WA50703]|jgi:hypothetical protein